MRHRELGEFTRIVAGIRSYEDATEVLPGVESEKALETLARQILDSQRRRRFVEVIITANISENRLDPQHSAFDPIRAAVLLNQQGSYEEACWLVFLATIFGKHLRDGWKLCAEFYAGNGSGGRWTYTRAALNPQLVRNWLAGRVFEGRFGNHRKYESKRSDASRSLGEIIASYIDWVSDSPDANHRSKFESAAMASEWDPKLTFGALYKSLDAVLSFGRTTRFDYLSMLGKTTLAPIEPDTCHLAGATGPLQGAQLLFGIKGTGPSLIELERKLLELGSSLALSMDILEDSLCNWQKSPENYIPFRG